MSANDRANAADWVRQSLPACAAVAAAFKAQFPGVRLTFASENGHTLGQRGPDGVKLSETIVGPMFPGRKAAK